MEQKNYNVKILATTIPYSEDIKHLDIEKYILYVARVSSPKNREKMKKGNNQSLDKLLDYLIINKHWSPFEHVSITIEMQIPKWLETQLLRHRSFTFQQESKRYTSEITIDYDIQLRKQSMSNRQSSTEKIDSNNLEYRTSKLLKTIHEFYNELINTGIAKECARKILPLTTITNFIMTGTIRSWITYLITRLHEDTEKEHRELAMQIKECLRKVIPNIISIYSNNDIK